MGCNYPGAGDTSLIRRQDVHRDSPCLRGGPPPGDPLAGAQKRLHDSIQDPAAGFPPRATRRSHRRQQKMRASSLPDVLEEDSISIKS